MTNDLVFSFLFFLTTSDFHKWKVSLCLWAEVWIQQCGICGFCAPFIISVIFPLENSWIFTRGFYSKPSQSLLETVTQLITSIFSTNSTLSLKTPKINGNLFPGGSKGWHTHVKIPAESSEMEGNHLKQNLSDITHWGWAGWWCCSQTESPELHSYHGLPLAVCLWSLI